MTARIAVLASGGGSNFEALAAYLDHLGAARPAEVVLVASDKHSAGALERARARGVSAHTIDSQDGGSSLERALHAAAADLVVLAGYLKLVPPMITRMFRGRVLNVHPALLPAHGGEGMYGARVHAAVLESGDSFTGPTVHFVDEIYDHGAIVARWPVPVRADDTAATLAKRVLRAEHALYPRVICEVASARIWQDEHGMVRGAPPLAPLTPDAARRYDVADETALGRAIDEMLAGR